METKQTWQIVDLRNGSATVGKPYNNRRRCQTRADKLNLEYGAHRFAVRNNITGIAY